MLERRAATAVAAGAVVAALWYLQSRRIRVNWQRVLRKRKHTFDQVEPAATPATRSAALAVLAAPMPAAPLVG